MAFIMKKQKSHGDELTHPWLPFTIWVDLGAWTSPAKKEEKVEKEIRQMHKVSLSLSYVYIF